MKAFGLGLATFFAGIFSVVASEGLSFIWLDLGPMDLTGNFFMLVVIPAHLIAQGIFVSLGAPLLRKNARLHVGIYAFAALLLYGWFLNFAFNPLSDILVYLASTSVTIAFWCFINRKRIF